MDTLAQDLKSGLRLLRRSPGFAAIIVLTLAIGIGANVAIFSVVNGVLLRPLPYRDPEQVVRLHTEWQQFQHGQLSPVEYRDLQQQATRLQAVAGWRFGEANLTGGATTEHVLVGRCTGNFLPLLGVAPQLGRFFVPEEERRGANRVLVLTHGFWQRHFGGDRGVVGRMVQMDDKSFTVVGVLPAWFTFPGDFEMWVPLVIPPEQLSDQMRGSRGLRVIGRLAPRATLADARAELDVLAGRWRSRFPESYPANAGFSLSATSLLERMTADVRPHLWMFVAAVALVLLIACVNVANLLLARATTRERELALRAALGAGRRRLVRQLLTENLIVSLAGGACGVLLALWGVDALLAMGPADLPRAGNIRVDGTVLAFALVIALGSNLLFGLLPALVASRIHPHDALAAGQRISAGRRPRRLRRMLASVELALALMLLANAGLLIRSFSRLLEVNPGFRPDHAVSLRIALSGGNEDRSRRFFTETSDALAKLPGVEAAGAINYIPMRGVATDNTFAIEGRTTPPGVQPPDEELRQVTNGYFAAMGMQLVRGRGFERTETQPVMVVNESFARKYFRSEDPLGRRIQLDTADRRWWTIVGVTGDIREFGLDAEVRPTMFFPHAQTVGADGAMTIVVRGGGSTRALADSVRAELARLYPSQPVFEVESLSSILSQTLTPRRFATVLLVIFAVLALVLAAIGLYGVMAYSVAQRTHEIGVRMALGAQRSAVMGLVLRESAGAIAVGTVAGALGALLGARLLGGLRYGVGDADPVSLFGAVALLVLVCLVASWVPARRASLVDPMVALRSE